MKSSLDPKLWSGLKNRVGGVRQQNADYTHFQVDAFPHQSTFERIMGYNTKPLFTRSHFESFNHSSEKDWTETRTNRIQCADFVQAYNHVRRRKRNLARLYWREYRLSLEWFNICRECDSPIKTKKSAHVKVVARRDNPKKFDYISATEEYADIPEHYEVAINSDNPDKLHYKLVPQQRIFNVKCGCYSRETRNKERLDQQNKLDR